jgi:hypothetical protein
LMPADSYVDLSQRAGLDHQAGIGMAIVGR